MPDDRPSLLVLEELAIIEPISQRLREVFRPVLEPVGVSVRGERKPIVAGRQFLKSNRRHRLLVVEVAHEPRIRFRAYNPPGQTGRLIERTRPIVLTHPSFLGADKFTTERPPLVEGHQPFQ
jgi:hypothetical protein